MKNWINELKFAIIEEDMDKLMLLADDIPTTDDIDLANEACGLIQDAVNLATQKKTLLRAEMSKLKTAQKYFS